MTFRERPIPFIFPTVAYFFLSSFRFCFAGDHESENGIYYRRTVNNAKGPVGQTGHAQKTLKIIADGRFLLILFISKHLPRIHICTYTHIHEEKSVPYSKISGVRRPKTHQLIFFLAEREISDNNARSIPK